MKMTEDAELIAWVAKDLSDAYRSARAVAGDFNVISHEQMQRERPVLYKAWLAVASESLSMTHRLAAEWVKQFVELGLRPVQRFYEPTDYEIAAQAEWDRKYGALLVRARDVGLLDEHVAKE